MEDSGIRKVSERILKEGRAMIFTLDNVPAGSLPSGTLLINISSDNPDIRFIDKNKSIRKFSAMSLLEKNSISGDILQKNSIQSAHLLPNVVTSEKINNNSITNEKLCDNSVSSNKIKNNSIIADKILNDCITSEKLCDKSITTEKIENESVTSDKICSNSIQNKHLCYRSISSDKIKELKGEKIEDFSITTNKLALKSITKEKIEDFCIDDTLLAKKAIIKSYHLSDGSVTESKLELNCIENKHVKKVEYNENSKSYIGGIHGDKIIPGSIDSIQIKAQSIDDSKIKNRTIQKRHLCEELQSVLQDSIKNENGQTQIDGDLQVKGKITATGTITGSMVFNPCFADLAEAYYPLSDKLEEGDLVEITNDLKVQKTSESLSKKYIGIVSNSFATCFGATSKELEDKKKIAVALIGRVPVKVIGKGEVGDYIYPSNLGMAYVSSSNNSTNSIGKLLEPKTTDEMEKVLCLIHPN